jgi:hypothetical protein
MTTFEMLNNSLGFAIENEKINKMLEFLVEKTDKINCRTKPFDYWTHVFDNLHKNKTNNKKQFINDFVKDFVLVNENVLYLSIVQGIISRKKSGYWLSFLEKYEELKKIYENEKN